jgi:toxin ParE1/3/4
MKVIITGPARKDLEAIGDWISTDNPVRARSFNRELVAAAKSLARYPRRFPVLPGREESDIRRRAYRSYLIFYRIEEKQVEVLRILNGARDYEALLFPEARK